MTFWLLLCSEALAPVVAVSKVWSDTEVWCDGRTTRAIHHRLLLSFGLGMRFHLDETNKQCGIFSEPLKCEVKAYKVILCY